MPPILLSITGASGAILGIRTLELLKKAGIETHLIISRAAELTIGEETTWSMDALRALSSVSYNPEDLGASPASGSFLTRGMLIVPCSIKTLSAVANSFTADLIARAADVTLKEGRPLLLALRETPLHRGHLRLLDQAARAGAIIFPPVPAFYGHPQSVDELVTALAARMLLRVGIDTSAYPKWTGTEDKG